ncbi:hypothetical protein AC578_7545 [Pseudocercospora eumusae]|uniref:Uncharacterized protein n=1 Tax=Pseudocercospora eumusae TaxID=321146 RepID=A0A139HRM2_9PEZI|nr:hypothetical protein AC578_7545 [Pseudocercospora eumusae]
MTTINNLSSLMGDIGMESQGDHPSRPQQSTAQSPNQQSSYPRRLPHHELWFQFPNLDLVSDKDDVWLPEPKNIDYRPQPNPSNFQMNEYGEEFYHMMTPNLADIDSSQFLDANTMSIFYTIDSHIENGDPEYRIRVQSICDGEQRTATWDLSIDQWISFLSIDRPWIQLLSDLVNRRSAQAYLASQSTLMSCDVVFAGDDASNWLDRWDSREPRTASLIAKRKLTTDSGIASIEVFDKGSCTVKLPCDHFVQITREEFTSTDELAWAKLSCPHCGTAVLTNDDLEEATITTRLTQLEDLLNEQKAWEGFDHAIKDYTPRPFPSEITIAALRATLRSFKAPELIVPKLLQQVNFEETTTALEALTRWLSQQDKVICTGPAELRKAFDIVVEEALRETCVPKDVKIVPTPPYWTRFLYLWLNRTINFLAYKRCSDFGKGHEGVHWHEVGGLWWSDPFELASQRDRVMNGLANFNLGDGGETDSKME